ncbi:hypothetical protein BH11ACT2_BH11ACT2_19210 [soil metagenome]
MRLLSLVVIPALVLALAGCADSAGPLVLPASEKSCADSTAMTDAVFALTIKNAGPHPIAITSLAFDASSHVRVKGSWVGDDTATRQAIPGATVPGNMQSTITVRLALTSSSTKGVASDLTVKYTDADRQRYVATSAAVIGFGPGGTCG